jgi:hypothetical protein
VTLLGALGLLALLRRRRFSRGRAGKRQGLDLRAIRRINCE